MSSDLMRLAGINSGYDTEAMIEKMMSSYQTKIDAQNKKLQKLTWQQEAYRDITSKLTAFKNKYFDILKRDTYLMSPSSFSKYKANITTKSGKESGLKVTTSTNATAGSHTIKVNGLATAAVTNGGQVAPQNFKLDVDKAMKDSKPDDGTGKYSFSLDVKVGNVAKTIEFSGADKDELLSSLNAELEDAFGTTSTGKAFLSASVNNGEFAFATSGNAIATVTEREGNFGMSKPSTKVAINMAAALTGKSSISVTVPNYYSKKEVTKNIEFHTVSSTYFDARSKDSNIKEAYLKLKKTAFANKYDVDVDKVTEDMMNDANFSYSSADAAADVNQQTFLNALNAAYGMEQGITFSINGSYITAKYAMNGSAAEFTMTSTCDATFGLRKGSATSYIDENTKLSDLGIVQNKKGEPAEHALPKDFNLDVNKAISKATADENGKYNFALDVTVDGVSKTIEFSGTDTNSIMKSLNQGLAGAFGSGKLSAAKNSDGTLGFKLLGGGTVSISEKTGNFGMYAMTDKVAFNPGDVDDNPSAGVHALSIIMNDANGKPITTTININGLSTPADFSDPDDAAFLALKEAAYRKANGLSNSDTVTSTDLAAFTYTAVDAAADDNADMITNILDTQFAMQGGITFEYADGILSAKDPSGEAVKFAVDSDDGNFGRVNGTVSHTVTDDAGDVVDGYSMTINGKTIGVDKNATISDLINAVNKSGAGVTMSYSKLEGIFKLTANDKGTGADIRIAEDDTLAQALKLTDSTMSSHTDGTNSTITIDGIEVEHNDNTYELDGITFDFAQVDPTEGETISVYVEKSYDDIKAAIKSFVEDYNKLIDEVYDYLDTARPQDKDKNYYEPLTDAEKEDMSEKEIEKWEEKAKTGILHNDNTVYGVMTRLRSALTTTITLEDGTKFGLYSMGIKTMSLLDGDHEAMQRGKLKLDEDRLDKVLNEKPDAVVELFTNAQNGVMSKVNNTLDSAVRSTATKQGTLVRKAGLATGTSAKDNAIYRQMEQINKRIETLKKRYEQKEDYWWSVFTNLEKMMSTMNSQMSYMQSYLGSMNTTNTQ